MSRAKQLSLLKDPRKNTKLWWIQKQHVYGGSLNYRKVARPFDSKKLNHTVFKAKLGKSIWFTKSEKMVRELIYDTAKRYGVKVKDLAVNHDHLHLLTYTKSRKTHSFFLRFVSAELGRRYARIRRKLGVEPGTLWIARPFTRLVSWGRRSVERVMGYIERNRGEALGFIEYQPRHHALAKFLASWSEQRELSSA